MTRGYHVERVQAGVQISLCLLLCWAVLGKFLFLSMSLFLVLTNDGNGTVLQGGLKD